MFGSERRDVGARLPSATEALAGRAEPIPTAAVHRVSGRPLSPPWPEGHESVLLGLGCFWGAERLYWRLDGVWVTRVGYAGGVTPNPTYREVCSGLTGHAEVVEVVFDPARVSFERLLAVFFEAHDPTQGMRQGNDVGTQYRSAIYPTTPAQIAIAERMRAEYAAALAARGLPAITTEIRPDRTLYPAEAEHQQYLAANPNGYCGLAGTGIACPIPEGASR
jgi:peptide-methionine (S)-S-oxide reductase